MISKILILSVFLVGFCDSTFGRTVKIRSDSIPNFGRQNASPVNRYDNYMQTRDIVNGPFASVLMKRKLFRGLQEPPQYIYGNGFRVLNPEEQRLNPAEFGFGWSPVPVLTYRRNPIILEPAFQGPIQYLRTSFPTQELYGRRRTIYPRWFESVYEYFGYSPSPLKEVQSTQLINGSQRPSIPEETPSASATPQNFKPDPTNINAVVENIMPTMPVSVAISAPILTDFVTNVLAGVSEGSLQNSDLVVDKQVNGIIHNAEVASTVQVDEALAAITNGEQASVINLDDGLLSSPTLSQISKEPLLASDGLPAPVELSEITDRLPPPPSLALVEFPAPPALSGSSDDGLPPPPPLYRQQQMV